MADAQLILQLSKNFFKRNNLIEMVFRSVQETIYYVRTFRSQRKLMAYRYALEMQKYSRIENSFQMTDPTAQGLGSKFNRRY